MKNRLFDTSTTDPALNLAVEETLLLDGAAGPALFLWQNAHTVVIGRGQNAWKECRSQLLEEEGGTLVRRTTGGGAVYHDLGNLNFSFVMPRKQYDVARQLNVIRRAAASFGIQTEASGRNDIMISGSGAKFSGNAFRLTQEAALHHGTILFDVDMQKLGRYLAPSPEKLKAKGVESVRSRVGNLKELAPHMTIPTLKEALWAAYREEYGPAETLNWQETLDQQQIAALEARNRSWDWVYGRTPRFDITLYNRFDWGQVEMLLSLKQAHVEEAQVYSDANDPELAARLERALTGTAFTPQALSSRLAEAVDPEDREVGQWLAGQQF